MRPDAYRYIRPDISRFMPAGSPIYSGHNVVKYFWPVERDDDAQSCARKFSLDQPRVPAGSPAGGQWTSDAVANNLGLNDQRVVSDASPDDLKPGTRVAQDGRPVDLLEERALGGHAIEGHVSKGEESLLQRVRREAAQAIGNGNFFEGMRFGSFTSLEAANKLVNSTLAQNPVEVDLVASGVSPRTEIVARFSSPTGYEAYMRNERSQPYIRPTYDVGVVIVPDRRAAKGYRVDTAYPMKLGR